MSFFKRVAELEERGEAFALCTVVDTGGPSPGRVGFRMVVLGAGHAFGTVGGGALEHHTIQAAQEVLRSGESRLLTYKLASKADDGIGMACGGVAKVYIEAILPRPHLVVAGGGHIGGHLTAIAARMGFAVTVVDDRPDFASLERHPHGSASICAPYAETFAQHPFPLGAYYVIVTHKHAGDEAVLRGILGRPKLAPAYVGCIGSHIKLRELFKRLLADGVARDALRSVYAPIGIDHGGQSAEEIALAIACEVVAARHGKALQDSMCRQVDLWRYLEEGGGEA